VQADELRKELSEVKAELKDLNQRLDEAEQEYEEAQTQLRKADVEQEEQLQRWVPPAFLTSRAHGVKWKRCQNLTMLCTPCGNRQAQSGQGQEEHGWHVCL